MALNKFFRFPFARSGDKTAVPDAVVPGGDVSYDQGYGPDYQLVKTNPQAKDIERDKMNQVFNDITTAIREYQTNGTPDWITNAQNGGVAFEYPAGARVRYTDGFIYSSLVAANTALPTDATKWVREDLGKLLTIRRLLAGAYIPTPGAKFVFVRMVGGGAGGGGAISTATGNTCAGLGGGGGSYLESIQPVATLTGQIVTLGTAGIGAGDASGTAGGSTSFGAVLTAPGGSAGTVGQQLLPPWLLGESGNGAAPSGGNLVLAAGESGGGSFALSIPGTVSGRGGSSPLGVGGGSRGTVRGAGIAGQGFGSGGGGALESSAGPGGLAGGNGTPGAVIVWEFGG